MWVGGAVNDFGTVQRQGTEAYVVLARQPAQRFCLLSGDVDGASTRELNVVEFQHLVVERLQRTFRDRDQADREVEARQPSSRLYQMRQMLEVDLDVLPLPDASNCWYEADCGVRADHPATSLQLEIGRQLVAFQTPRPRPARRHECEVHPLGIPNHPVTDVVRSEF